jgi:hypothetical protein
LFVTKERRQGMSPSAEFFWIGVRGWDHRKLGVEARQPTLPDRTSDSSPQDFGWYDRSDVDIERPR